MKASKWNRILTIKKWETNKEVLRVGDVFLTGSSMIGQKERKKIGDEVSYFKVIKIEDNNIEYSLNYSILKGE